MLTGSFEELHAAGCIQTGADHFTEVEPARARFGQMFTALMGVTGGQICDGCPAYLGGTCKAYRQYDTAGRIQAHLSGLNSRPQVKQIAKVPRCPKCGLKMRGSNHEANCKGTN